MMEQLSPGDIVIGDRGFSKYVLICLLSLRHVDFIGRSTRRFKKALSQRRLGPNEIYMFLIALNLIRLLILECVNRYEVPPAILILAVWSSDFRRSERKYCLKAELQTRPVTSAMAK